jgi:hypothetical protein
MSMLEKLLDVLGILAKIKNSRTAQKHIIPWRRCPVYLYFTLPYLGNALARSSVEYFNNNVKGDGARLGRKFDRLGYIPRHVEGKHLK